MLLFEIITFGFLLLFGILINGISSGDVTTTSEPSEKCTITVTITKDWGEIETTNYPKPYPTNCVFTYIIHIGYDHKLKLVIRDCDVDTESGDALIIESAPGIRIEIENHSKQSPITKESTSDDTHSAVITLVAAKEHANTHRGFSMTFERIEEPSEKSRENELPGWLQLYLAGVSAFEVMPFNFNLITGHFKEALAKITKQYIDEKHMSHENESQIENDIIINSMVPCPSSWPWSSNCIQLNFSIKLTDNPFELNSEHLQEVWDSHRSSEEFYELGISEYELPDVEWFIWFWIFMIGFISIVFAFLLVIVVRTKLIHYYFLKLQDIRTDPAIRTSQSWTSHPTSYPFNVENSQRFQFMRAYERDLTRPTYSKNSAIDNASYDNHSQTQESIDDFDSEDDQHIYHSLSYKK